MQLIGYVYNIFFGVCVCWGKGGWGGGGGKKTHGLDLVAGTNQIQGNLLSNVRKILGTSNISKFQEVIDKMKKEIWKWLY